MVLLWCNGHTSPPPYPYPYPYLCDPNLTIKVGEESFVMTFISNQKDPWFKFLGRFLLEELTERVAKERQLTFFTVASEKVKRVHCLAAIKHGFGISMLLTK